jgi:hypothetical protein
MTVAAQLGQLWGFVSLIVRQQCLKLINDSGNQRTSIQRYGPFTCGTN